MDIREQIKRLREIEDDDSICGVDCGRTSSCNAAYAIGEAADTMEAMLEVVEALDEYRDSLRDLFPNAIDDSSKLGKALDKLKALQTNDD